VFLPGGGILRLCITDSRRLENMSAFQRAEAAAELVERAVPDRWRVAA
jgi:hypothetical protein